MNLEDLRQTSQTPTGSYKCRIGDRWSAESKNWKAPLVDGQIDQWWSARYVGVLEECIRDFQWCWAQKIASRIWPVVDEEIAISWARADPRIDLVDGASSKVAIRDQAIPLIERYAASYARAHGLLAAIRVSQTKPCAFCGEPFEERALAPIFIACLGTDNLEVCGLCLTVGLLPETIIAGSDDLTKEEVGDFARRLTAVIGRIPPMGFGMDYPGSFRGLSPDQLADVMEILGNRPSRQCIKRHFGSWLEVLIDAGVIEDGAQRTSRGIKSIAIDGHVCHSIGERTIDDLLTNAGIIHTREPAYPTGLMRGDFLVGETIVEYLGLLGAADYDAKTERKKSICEESGVVLLLIKPEMLGDLKRLERIFKAEIDRAKDH